MSSPLTIERIHHVEFFVGNALQAAYYYRKAFGFDQIAYMGPETGHPDRCSYVLRQGNVRLVVTSPLTHEDSRNVFLTLHGDAVRDLAFEVDDAAAAYEYVVSRGAVPLQAPTETADTDGSVQTAAVRTYGETIHTFVSHKGYKGVFMPGYREEFSKGNGTGILNVDHVVGNVEDRQMDRWADYYTRIFGFHQFLSFDDKDISTEFTALRSKVMASHDLRVRMPINEPAAGRRKSQIQEYIDFHVIAGVQHVAMITDDIVRTISHLRENGVEFLHVPDTYYDTVWDRVGDIDEDREDIKRLNILADRDESGYLLQLFTKPQQPRPTFFIEIIQRRGCNSFGKGNFKALFESIEREQELRGNL